MPLNLIAMKFSKASKGSSQSSKGRKPSLLSQLMRPIKRFGKSLRKKSDTPQSESETRHVTPSTTVSLPVVEPSTAQGLDTIASMTEPTTTTAPAPAATASDTTASGPTASAPDASAIRPPVAAHSNVPPSSPEHSTADAAVPNREKSEAVTSIPANRDMNELKEMSLWDKACVSLKARDQDSKYVSKVTEFHPFNGTMQVLFFLDPRRLGSVGCDIKYMMHLYSPRIPDNRPPHTLHVF